MSVAKMASEEYVDRKVGAKYTKPGNGIPSSDMASEVQSSLGKADTALQQHQDISHKADKDTTYTKTEVDEKLQAVKNGSRVVVQELPESGEPLVIYMVPKSTAQTNNSYDEYIWLSTGAWEKIGDTTIDLSGKADKVANATSGNLAGLDSNGNLTDSGKKPADFASEAEAEALRDGKLDKSGGTMTGTLGMMGDINLPVGKTQHRLGVVDSYDENEVYITPTRKNTGASLSSLLDIAPFYGSSTSYVVGQLCIKDDALVKCTTAGTGSAAVFAEATVEDVLAALRTGKADKPTTFTTGNLAKFDANGNPTDSGYRFEVRNGVPYIIETTND